MAKRGKLAAMLTNKCPRCHEGDMFKTGITGGIYNMYKKCPNCGQAFELEPGFYWGAMYIGYGLSAAYMLTVVTSLILGVGWSTNAAFITAIIGGVIVMPLIARLARSIWIHIYVKYDKRLDQKVNKEKENTVNTSAE